MTTEGAGPWRVSEGALHVYRLFDVADAIDLARAEALIAAPTSRLRLESSHSTTALEIPRPPVHLALGPRTLPLVSARGPCQASAHLFDYGVVSIVYRLEIPPGTSLEALLPFAEELVAAPTPALDRAARREAEELSAALGAALDRPHAWDGLETYHVWVVRAFDRPATAEGLLETAPLAQLILGETSPTPLSRDERDDVLKHHFSYLADDLAVVDWNTAFVHEPSGVPDVQDLLEFATAHLLELRFYDALLDRELQRIYDEIEAKGLGPTPNPFTRRYLRLQRHTAALLLELSEMIERLDNAVKIIGDFYLARLYQSAVRRFRLPAWEESVLRKQRLLSEVNGLLSHAADTRRGEMLELTIIALILWEILYALLRR